MASENTKKWRVILLCIGGAITFWLFNALNQSYTTEINYPVNFALDQGNMEFTEDPPHQIPLEVTGGGWSLLRYLLHFDTQPIEISVRKVARRGRISREKLYSIFSKNLKDLKVNRILLDTIHVHTHRKATPKAH